MVELLGPSNARRGFLPSGRALAAEASAKLGETFVLRPRGAWGFGASLPTAPETTALVRATFDRHLPRRPGMVLNATVILLVIAALLVAVLLAILPDVL